MREVTWLRAEVFCVQQIIKVCGLVKPGVRPSLLSSAHLLTMFVSSVLQIPGCRALARWPRWLGLGVVCGGLALPAQAVVELAVQLDTSWSSDSNPLRLPVGSDVQTLLGRPDKRDSTMSADLRAAMMAPLGSDGTRLELVATQGKRQYQHETQLDHEVRQLDARLYWQLTPLWRGRVTYGTDERLYQPQNNVQVGRDLMRQQVGSSELALRVTEDLSVPLTLERLSVRHENPQNQFLDRNDHVVQLALRYTSPLGSAVQLGSRRTGVDYPNRGSADAAVLDTHYTDQLHFVDVDWVYSPMTQFGGRLGLLQRHYDSLSDNNFDHRLATLRAIYQPSPLTRIDAEWGRRIYDSSTPSALYFLSSGLRVGLDWRWSELTRVRLQASHDRQQNQIANLPGASPAQADNMVNRLGASVNYTISRGWRLYAEGLRDRFTTVGGGTAIQQNVFRLGLEYTYESVAGTAARAGLGRRP